MQDQSLATVGTSVPPSSAWVRFLRTYGPTPNNLTMFDEYVAGAIGRAKVQPIALSTPMLEPMNAHLASGKPGSMLIAGTAGDANLLGDRCPIAAIRRRLKKLPVFRSQNRVSIPTQ